MVLGGDRYAGRNFVSWQGETDLALERPALTHLDELLK